MSLNYQGESPDDPNNKPNTRTSLGANETEQPEDYESLKLRMKRKITDYFNLHKNLSYEKFNEFMDYIDLSQIFSTDDLEVIWKTFTIISDGREIIDIEEAIKGVNELLSYFYTDNTDLKGEESNAELNQAGNSPKESKNSDKYILQSDYEIKIEHEAENSGEPKGNLSDKSLGNNVNKHNNTEKFGNHSKNTSNKNINLNFDKLEINNQASMINRSRQNSVNLSSTQINNLFNAQSANNSAIKPSNPKHKRNITKIFKEIDIETLKQLRRVFSLLDIRNKEVLYMRELRDILKYKFINLTFDQLFDFLLNLSYDSDYNKLNNFESIQKQGKININFQLYSRAISAIEQKILNENFEEFQETLNDSYEVRETFGEVYENINQLDSESKDYISVLADIFISLRQKYETESSEINGSLASLINICINNNEPKDIIKNLSNGLENIKKQIVDYFKISKEKHNDIEIFLKDLNKNNLQACNKFSLLKLISEKYERTIKGLEEDYKLLFQKYNTTQPLEVNDELEQLMDENAYLKDELENKHSMIESLRAELREKDEHVFNVRIELEKMNKINKDIEKDCNYYKRSYTEVQKDYEKLRNEIYEKILKEEEEASTGKSSLNSKRADNEKSLANFENEKKNFVRNSIFLKQKFLKEESENANKILEMSYEKLVMYCLDIEKANGKFNTLFAEKEAKIKSLELEIEHLNNLNQENSKKLYLLTSENARLNARLNDILRENEFNKGFRPSIALNNRISRMSNIRGTSMTPNHNANSLFEPNKKNNNFFAFNKDKINNILQNKNDNFEINSTNGINSPESKNIVTKSDTNVNRKLQFETSEKNEFSSVNNKNENNCTANTEGKGSIFDIYKEEQNKNELRLSTLEMEDEESQPKKLNVKFIQKDVDVNEDEVGNLNDQLIAQQREFIKSASNFQIKYNSAFDTKITENNLNEQNRNSHIDYNPFIIDDNAGFTFRNRKSIGEENYQNENNQGKHDDKDNCNFNSKETDNHFTNKNISESNYLLQSNSKLNNHSNYNNNNLNNTNLNDESSHFYNNTRRPTYMSNNQGIINEISRISSFNFDKDLPNQDDWETNDIINNADEIGSTVDHERKYIFDFSGKTKKDEFNQVNQIVDDIEDFEVNENAEGKASITNDNKHSGDSTKQDSGNNPFGSELGKAINNHLNSKNNHELGVNKNQFAINSNVSAKDSSNFNISKTIHSSLNSTKSDERTSKKYSLMDNESAKNKKIDYSKAHGIKEISDKIPEEEDHEEDELEKKDEVEPIEKFSIGGLNSNAAKPTHNRNATMDLDKEFTKPSEYMCYDFLTLRRNVAIINMLDRYNEGVSSYEMFSENIHYFDDQKKKTKRYLFITCNAIYILRPYDISEKVRIPLSELVKITISNKNCNLIVFHFSNSDDMMLEILRRMELLYYFRDLYKIKSFGKLRLRYSDNFKIRQGGILKSIIIDQSNNLFIAPNFENAQKLAYIEKLCGGFFQRFKEKLVVLTNIGLMYFNDPKDPPRKLIPIIGSKIEPVEEKKYNKRFCFEIKTLNNDIYVFAVKTKDDLQAWIKEFELFKVNYQKMMKGVDDKTGSNNNNNANAGLNKKSSIKSSKNPK